MSSRKLFGVSENGRKFSYASIQNVRSGESNSTSPRNIHFHKQSHKVLSTRESTRNNIWKSHRSVSLGAQITDLRMVPTLLKENIRLFTSTDPDELGMFYMKEDTFYNKDKTPEYALSVSPDIYQQIMTEVNDSYSTPLGLYFCCHGGDGAHTGVAHEDFVDIKVAWILVSFLMTTIIVLSALCISTHDYDN